MAKYFETKFGTGSNKEENATRLQAHGFVLSEDIIRYTISGETATLTFGKDDMNKIAVTEKLNTHTHGREYHQKIGKIGLEIGMEYSYMNTIIRKLFDRNFNYSRKILAKDPRMVYAFVINNADLLRRSVREAMASELAQMRLDFQNISKVKFHIPQSCMFTFDSSAKTQTVMSKMCIKITFPPLNHVLRPNGSLKKFCERAENVQWVYKNGDKGSEFLSIVYADNSGKQKNFFPDYIIGVNNEIWIVENERRL